MFISIKVSLTRLIHSVHRPFVRSDLGHLVLSPRSAHHSVRCHLLWVWLCGVDASDPVCLHPSLQLWRTHVANSVQQVRVYLYNLKLSFSIHLTLNMTSPQVVETSITNNSSFQNLISCGRSQHTTYFFFKFLHFAVGGLGSLLRLCQLPTHGPMICCHLSSTVLQNTLFGMLKSQL